MTWGTPTRRGARRALLATAVLALTAPASAPAMTLTEAVEAAVQHDPAVRASIAQAEAEREAGAQDIGTFDFRTDTSDLFSVQPDNIFLIKVSYWLNL